VRDLIDELSWPEGIDVGVIETAGGLRSPLAADGDTVDLISALAPDHVVLVADAGLGTINVLRLSLGALVGRPVIVYLNRLDEADELHRRNREWIELRMGIELSTGLGGLVERIIPS
jgi:dethiobiotin synthetase